MRQKPSRIFMATLVSIVLLTSAVVFPHPSYGQPLKKGVQDVIIILDNSGSMFREVYPFEVNDPRGWRFVAGAVVVNYLAVAADPSITYRVALLSYAREAVTLANLSELEEAHRAELTRMLDPEHPAIGNIYQGYTNPHFALEHALKELEAHPNPNPVRPPIVILLTDGDFGDNSQGIPTDQYVEKVESAVLALAKRGAVVHAVLLGEKAKRNQTEWERLTALTGGEALLVDKAKKLPAAYIQLVRSTVGAIGVGSKEMPIKAKETKGLPFSELGVLLDDNERNYVDNLVVTVWQTHKGISITFVNPRGETLVPIPGEVERRGSDYVVVWRLQGTDLLTERWKVRLYGGSKDGSVQVFVDYLPLRLVLSSPSGDIPVLKGKEVTFVAQLVDRNGVLFKASEALKAQLNLYCGVEAREPFLRKRMTFTEGEYRFTYRFDQPGIYIVELFPLLHLKGGGNRFLQPPRGQYWFIKVVQLPAIRDIQLEPSKEAEVGEPIRLRVAVQYAEIQEGLSVLAQVRESESRRVVWEEELRPGLGGIFEGGPFSLKKAGPYDLVVSLRGETQVPGAAVGFRYGPDTPHPIQREKGYIAKPPVGFGITDIKVGKDGRIVRGQEIPIIVQILCPEGASIHKVETAIKDREPTRLHDDGQPPDEQEGDGLFSGVLPPLSDVGSYQVEAWAEGRSIYGIPMSAHKEITLAVEPPFWQRYLSYAIRSMIMLLFLCGVTFGACKWQEERRRTRPLGTLRILYHPLVDQVDQRGRQWFLGNYGREVTLGINDGLISLSPIGQSQEGLYARFYGQREGRFPQLPWWLWWLWWAEWLHIHLIEGWRREEVVTYVEGISEEMPISVSGSELSKREKACLFEGSTLEIGKYTLEYIAPRLEPY